MSVSEPSAARSSAGDSEHPSRSAGASETVGLATAYVGAESLNRQENIDSAEAAGNAGMDSIVGIYANNTPQSLTGFMAEQEYVRSFNIHAAEKGFSPSEVSVTRLGSHEANSPDILTSWGETYQPKFYATPEGTAGALTEIIEGENGLVNRYADQQLLAPADQIDQVRSIVHGKIDAALAAGDTQQADLLSDSLSRLTDRITFSGGVTSDTLSYDQSRAYAIAAQSGGGTDLGDGFNPFDSGALIGEHAAMAAGLSVAIGASEILLSASGELLSGKITGAEMSARISGWWEKTGKTTSIEAGGRSMAAGGLASLDALDPTGAVVIATLAWDLAKLGSRASRGELRVGEVEQTLKRIALYKLPVIGVSAATVSVFGGPAGTAVVVVGHLMARELIRQHAVQQACIGFLSDIQNEMENSARMLVEQSAITERALTLAEFRGQSADRTLRDAEATRQSSVSINGTAKEILDEGNWSVVSDTLKRIRRSEMG